MTRRIIGKLRTGFTLLELLIVIAVIGGLAAISVNTFPAATRKARDSTRKSDIKQYQTAMEGYYNKNSKYITQATAVKPSSMCVTLGLTSSACPNDPKDGTTACSSGSCIYQYVTDGTASTYAFWTRLESPAIPASAYYIVCSDGRTYEGATAPTSANPCP